MGKPDKAEARVAAFIDSMKVALRENAAQGNGLPIERRLLSTVTKACGAKATEQFCERLEKRLQENGIYTDPPLTDSGLRRRDWVHFSTGPFPPDALLFASEKHLQRFVESCIGRGAFRNLRLYRGDRGSAREFRLPSGEKIDLLCEEITRNGVGALVAVELKRDQQKGTVEQLVGYLDALKILFPSREVRGVIVSGREDRVATGVLKGVTRYRIDWYLYHVDFSKASV